MGQQGIKLIKIESVYFLFFLSVSVFMCFAKLIKSEFIAAEKMITFFLAQSVPTQTLYFQFESVTFLMISLRSLKSQILKTSKINSQKFSIGHFRIQNKISLMVNPVFRATHERRTFRETYMSQSYQAFFYKMCIQGLKAPFTCSLTHIQCSELAAQCQFCSIFALI